MENIKEFDINSFINESNENKKNLLLKKVKKFLPH